MKNNGAASKKALILGAGIGGLTTALFLQKQGWDIAIYEKKQELSEFGAGIVLAANAMHVLKKLDVADKVKQAGAKVGKADIRAWEGRAITSVPVDLQADKYKTYSYLIHRAKLQAILAHELGARVTLHMNKKLNDIVQDETGVTLRFEDGSEDKGHLLIGCDGIHSQSVALLFGHQPLRYSGFHALRGITTFTDQRYPREIGGGFEAWGKGKRFGFSQIGENQVYWFAAVNSAPGAKILLKKEHALQQFKGWFQPIEAVIQSTAEASILFHDIYDRVPLKSWSKGRVTLLGDAAHPMLPNLGQGGAQAMEDASVLADCLSQIEASRLEDLEAALAAYERTRMPRAHRVVQQSRRMSRVVQMSNPIGLMLRNKVLGIMPAKVQISQLDWLLGHRV
ncbi:FAD-dependent monooxygenase [Paenibacillus sp. HWE-109]|uniref:FAD-dependent monooxygenase n=1 Tax=Paenibacillus sp. HWE-109 TaxID=1306526 RepID=UPI001EDF4B75|nr:FAD-dependent monooxygenase [Paenibacillus sp. HWE-109]UKS29098.1 FAD-dependent monooxygenase [Paenibacillus sp. HWE-109]